MNLGRCVAVILALILASASPLYAYTDQEQEEIDIGKQTYQQLSDKGEIVRRSPLYDVLTPLGKQIAAIADRQYFAPFSFTLVNEKQPNAFAVPGGGVYVTLPMMSFAKNREELGSVLCHEVSHDIHHDVMNLYAKNQRLSIEELVAQLLLGGGSIVARLAIDMLTDARSAKFSREVEHNADMTGAHICAQAGINPWGMVWLMRRFEAQSSDNPPEFLADHPSDSHRISDLERLFASEPQTFGKFNPDISSATPLK